MNETNQECQNEQEILNDSEIEVEEKVSQVEEESSEASKEEEAEAKIAQMKDQLLRTMAEFDNYRKRTTKEKEQIFNRGVSYVVEAILPVIDNLERALSVAKDREDNFVKGVEMTYNQMLSALKNLGVEQMDVLGQTFDPHFHDAMQHIEDEQYGESEIVDVFQKGYMLNDVVIRPSLVKVAN
ncbi:MAG: nucleotide exchange factor GrpE [Firmicutes bacterium]|nr:nucleotide exchange factor GrpE [Bacillota bacterium]